MEQMCQVNLECLECQEHQVILDHQVFKALMVSLGCLECRD